jgi:hypothetical protein
MSPVDVLAMVKKLDRRTSAIEQILPTLATKEDLKAFATKEDLKAFATKADLDEVKRFVLVLHEDLKSDIGLIAEHLADVMTRLPPREAP